MNKWLWLILLTCAFQSETFGSTRVINLNVGYKTVYFNGKPVQAMAIDNQIPAPALHFRQGDDITLNVFNHLKVETALHWHGLILPWQMDGVLGITQQGIPPGKSFQYHFKLYQSGTYWYHAHAGLQEQRGIYGAFIIDPPKAPRYAYDQDFSLVLSDWSDTLPHQVLHNLKKSGEYYAPRFPLQASLLQFLNDYNKAGSEEKQKLLMDYKMMQQMRMGIYDISDVAYDAFLLNGTTKYHPWRRLVKKGDTVRLRFIGAGGNTFFKVKIPGSLMQVVHVQGNDVTPYWVKDFSLAPGETVDVLVQIKENKPYLIYAESADTLGFALGALVTSPTQAINPESIKPFPKPKPTTREKMHLEMLQGKGHHMMHGVPSSPSMATHPKHPMNKQSTTNIPKAESIGSKYQHLKAAVRTNHPNKPVYQTIQMKLSGYMDRFIWFINDVPGYNAKPILLQPGKRYRVVFTNKTMMHHPMHIHGHWFILQNGNGTFNPLLHTLDVPPGGKIVAYLDTDASGQWFFHCHMLYHMMTGMSRVFQYSSLIELSQKKIAPQRVSKTTQFKNRPIVRVDELYPFSSQLVRKPEAHAMERYLANRLDFSNDFSKNQQTVNYNGLYGSDFHKIELFINEAEIAKGSLENADIDIFYWYLVSQFWTIKTGANYFYKPSHTPYWQPGMGIEGLMPYFIDTNLRTYFHRGSIKFDLELARDTQVSNNFFIRTGLRGILATKTIEKDWIGAGLNELRLSLRPYYRLAPGLSVFIEYEHEQLFGPLKRLQLSQGGLTKENTLSLGLSLLL